MVAGLKISERVSCHAKKVFGASTAKKMYPDTWESLILQGSIVKRGQRRSVIVLFDGISRPHQVSTRSLSRVESESKTGSDSEDDTVGDVAARRGNR